MKNQEEASSSPVGPIALASTAWVRSMEHLFKSAVEVNRATRAAFGVGATDSTTEGTRSLAYRRPEWRTEIDVEESNGLRVGDTVSFSKTITSDDVERFASISGDTNRLHLDESFAASSRFGGTIAHGALVSSLISAALARLPGLVIYLSQDVRFLRPVQVGDELTAMVEIIEDLGENRYRLGTSVRNEPGELVIDGEAQVLIDDHPERNDES